MSTTIQNQQASEHDVLAGLGIEPGHTAIVGLQWGDEGKGKVVDLLAPGYDYVVRYNGGANAGHSVVVGDQRFSLHLIPSGILDSRIINVLGNGVVIDLAQLDKEIKALRERGVSVEGNLRISDRAHLVLPYHKIQDALLEKLLPSIGTTGRGIGPCYADKALRTTALRVGDLLDAQRAEGKIRQLVHLKNHLLTAMAREAGETFEPLDPDAVIEQTLAYQGLIRQHIADTAYLLHDAMKQGQHLLFEGANATLLDIDHGTYPYVTSSNCSALGLTTGTGVPGHRVPHVLGIVKAYQTRVGGGPMVTELLDAVGDRIREKGREYGTTTGRPRRCGWLDLVALRYTSMVSGATGLCIMLMDVLSGLDELKLCTHYEIEGQRLDHFPAQFHELERATAVYETLPGFQEDLSNYRQWSQLPPAARAYLDRIEEALQVPICMASVGPRRDQTLFRHA